MSSTAAGPDRPAQRRVRARPPCRGFAGPRPWANGSLQRGRKPWAETSLLLFPFFSSGSMSSSPFLSKHMKRAQAPDSTPFLLHGSLLSNPFPASWCLPLLSSLFPTLLCLFSLLPFLSSTFFSLLYPIHSFQGFLSFEVLMFLLAES